MAHLVNFFKFFMDPAPPYDFRLTVRRPAGWPLFTPFEIYENETLWTATHLDSVLVGIRLSSIGTVDDPHVSVQVFYEVEQTPENKKNMERLIRIALGAGQDLTGFYAMSRKDSILKHAIDGLYGMHDTFPVSIFPEAVLAILLQMAPLKRSNEMMASFIQNYGDIAEFDGREVLAWPTPGKISVTDEAEIAKKCRAGYRAGYIVKLARRLQSGGFPSAEQILAMGQKEAKKALMELPGIGDYSADIISPHGGFPIDAWSAEVFAKLFFDRVPENNRKAVEEVKKEGLRRWGEWSWLAFYYIVQDLPGLSRKLGKDLRLS